MKTKLKLILLFPVAFAVACEGYLTEEPFSSVDPASLFNDEQGALAAINATYKLLSDDQDWIGRDYLYITETTTETITTRRDASDLRGQMDNWLWDESHGFLAQAWESAYSVINAANGVIENVSDIKDMDADLRNRIVGEAKFLRAFAYFHLVRLWGDVPIRTEQIKGASDQLELPRSPASEVYSLIIQDLEDAEGVLPTKEGYNQYSGPNTGRATRGAARTLLAKVYLQKGATSAVSESGDFQQSLDWSNKVIQEEDYELVDDYRSIFAVESENGPEVIFDIQHTNIAGLGGDLSGHVVPRHSGIGRRSWGNFHAEVPFFMEYNSKDQRHEAYILEYEQDGDSVKYNPDNFENDDYVLDGPSPFKLAEFDSGIGGDAQERPNKVMLRYADVLLMKAEAINEINNGPDSEAYDAVNLVRARAGIDDLASGLDYQPFKDSLLVERRKELIFEYHGWFDGLRNWDFFIDRVLANVQTREKKIASGEWPNGTNAAPRFFTGRNIRSDKFKLFPVPRAIMDTNPKLEQNPGW